MHQPSPGLQRRTFLKTGLLAAAGAGVLNGETAQAAAPAEKKIAVTDKIPTRKFGKTGHTLPILGMGGSAMVQMFIRAYGVPLLSHGRARGHGPLCLRQGRAVLRHRAGLRRERIDHGQGAQGRARQRLPGHQDALHRAGPGSAERRDVAQAARHGLHRLRAGPQPGHRARRLRGGDEAARRAGQAARREDAPLHRLHDARGLRDRVADDLDRRLRPGAVGLRLLPQGHGHDPLATATSSSATCAWPRRTSWAWASWP